jgi:hypothetical protein
MVIFLRHLLLKKVVVYRGAYIIGDQISSTNVKSYIANPYSSMLFNSEQLRGLYSLNKNGRVFDSPSSNIIKSSKKVKENTSWVKTIYTYDPTTASTKISSVDQIDEETLNSLQFPLDTIDRNNWFIFTLLVIVTISLM